MSDTVSKYIVADAFLEALAEVSETHFFLRCPDDVRGYVTLRVGSLCNLRLLPTN